VDRYLQLYHLVRAELGFFEQESKVPGKSGIFSLLSVYWPVRADGLDSVGVLAMSAMKREGRLVQGRRQGGVSTPRRRNGCEEGIPHGARAKAGVHDDQDPSQRHDGECPDRERR